MRNIFNKYFEKYDAWFDKYPFAYRSELNALKKVIPKKGRFLEIGSGTGRFTRPLGIRHAIDPSAPMRRLARQRGVDVKRGRGENLPFKNGYFDAVIYITTYCFLKSPEKSLHETWRVLKRGGRVIIAVVDKDSFLGKFYQKRKNVFYDEATFFSVQDIIDTLYLKGFRDAFCYQTIFSLPRRMKKLDRARKGFGRGGFVVLCAKKSIYYSNEFYRKFVQYEKVRLLFKRYGYDMDQSRQKVIERAGWIKGPVLDVGTGPGRMAYALALSGHQVVTVDTSKTAQGVAKLYCKKFGVLNRIVFKNMNAEFLNIPDESFSTTIAANLLHDVKCPARVVREMIRVTKPLGCVVVSDLNRAGVRLVRKVYRIDTGVRQSKLIDLDKIVRPIFLKHGIVYKRYNEGLVNTFVGHKKAGFSK